MQIDLRKIYRFTEVSPPPGPDALPAGASYYYECQDCTVIVNSVPHVQVACACGNLQGSGGALTVQKPDRVKVFTGKLK